jgi:hypothetical protein
LTKKNELGYISGEFFLQTRLVTLADTRICLAKKWPAQLNIMGHNGTYYKLVAACFH